MKTLATGRFTFTAALLAGLAGLPALAAAPPSAAQAASESAPIANVERRDAIVRAVESVGPAVVNISTEKVVENPFYGGGSLFEWFFGRGSRAPERLRRQNSLGSGVIVDEQGHVLTNDHVIAAADRITVTLQDGRQVEAKVVGSDRASDLAVLELAEEGPWPVAPLGSSDDLMPGETVIAIGNPFGLQSTVTVGVVSATGRLIGGEGGGDIPFADFIQTDAAINPGNSGGALLNIHGELIGINSQIVARAQNLGFAIPIDRARKIYNELLHYGQVRPAWTGLVVEEVDRDIAANLGMDAARGVYVRRIFADSPAAESALRAGDVVLEVGGTRVDSLPEFDTALAKVEYGKKVNLRVFRNGETRMIPLRVEVFPQDRARELAFEVLGLTVTDHRGPHVLIDQIRRGSEPAERGVRQGMGIFEINGKRVRSAEDFYEEIPRAILQRSVNLGIIHGRGYGRLSYPLR
jgi:serine protease Do